MVFVVELYRCWVKEMGSGQLVDHTVALSRRWLWTTT